MKKEIFTPAEVEWLKNKVPQVKHKLLRNLYHFDQYEQSPLLKAGDVYAGIWLEHNQDNFFLADYDPEAAWGAQEIFMRYQREDGLLPFAFPCKYDECSFLNEPVAFWQVQCVWSFTRCAWEIARKTKRPHADIVRLYDCGSRYDAWFGRFRNQRRTGLVEMFCEYDTGHDNDPRVTTGNIPGSCPDGDAVNMPDLPCMPVLSVDLSAMLYGNRMALAEIAGYLGKKSESRQWREMAETIRIAIKKYLYCQDDDFFYDRDYFGFRKYRTEHITRLFLNHVLTQEEFEPIYNRYFEQPGREFCPAFPIPSMSISDPHFIKICPKNSWGGNSQALTVLRALFWMDYYQRSDDLMALLSIWLRAAITYQSPFRQEISPFDGHPIGDVCNYSPALIVFLEAVKRVIASPADIVNVPEQERTPIVSVEYGVPV